MRIDIRCWFVGLCLFAVATVASASGFTAAPACSSQMLSLSGVARMMTDKTGQMGPSDVMHLPLDDFQGVVAGRQIAYGGGAVWVRIDLRNTSDATCHRWLLVAPPRVRDIRVYVKRADGWKAMRGGAAYPLREWAIPRRQPLFPLALAPGVTTHVLVRIYRAGGLQSLTPELWAPDHYRQVAAHRTFIDGLEFGSLLLLVLISLAIAGIYRRPALCLMALTVGFFLGLVASEGNYLFVYLWPGLPELNTWSRFFFTGMLFAAGYCYLYLTVRVHRLEPWWSYVFAVMVLGFVLVGLIGSIVYRPWHGALLVLSFDLVGRWLLAAAVVHGFRRGTLRGWYAPTVVGLLCIRTIWIYGHFLGLPVSPLMGKNVYVPTVLAAGLLLLGTLISQTRKGRRAELRTRAAFNRQRETERKRLEAIVARRTYELDRALKERRHMLGRISHDLRSPLAAMLDSARLWRSGDQRRDYSRLIERHANRQMELIDELLEFSGMELATSEVEPVPGYLHAFLGEVVETAELNVERGNSELRSFFSDDLPAVVRADFRSLRRVLNNLLGNAGKYARQGHINFVVERLATDVGEGMACLHFIVDDDGPGVPVDERKRLLQPFTRGDNVTDVVGSGLGLAIVTLLLQRMGSHIEIDDSPIGGSRFHFELALPLAEERDLEPSFEEGGHVDIDGDGRVILVVDDDRQQRELVRDLLEGCGFDTLGAADGVEALHRLQQQPEVDVVLTDQRMPGMDGWRLLEVLRRKYSDLPVLLYSSLPARRPETLDATLSFDAVLLKPADSDVLLDLVHAHACNKSMRPA